MRYYLDDVRPQYEDGGWFSSLVNWLTPKSKPKAKPKTKAKPKRNNNSVATARRLNAQTNAIKPAYIGGTTDQARQEFWRQEPVLVHATDSIGAAYGIPGELIRNRMNYEGMVDQEIKDRNSLVKRKQTRGISRGYELLHEPQDEGKGFRDYGLDDAATYINNGQTRLINERWTDEHNTNEEGRTVHSANGLTTVDNMGIQAATLAMFKNQAKQDFPGLSDAEYNELALAYFNRGIGGGRTYKRSGKKDKRYSIRTTYASGGSIHIKPENRGKFTETMRRTGKTAEQLKHSSNPLTRKRATFAINAKKWNH